MRKMSTNTGSQEFVHFYSTHLGVSWFLAYLVVFFFYQITPLHVAAERGHPRMVEYLVNKGANKDIQDKKGVIMCDYSNHSVATIAYLSLS